MVDFNVSERITIPAIFPKTSNFIDMQIRSDINLKLVISQEEMAAVGMESAIQDGGQGNRVTWDLSKETPMKEGFSNAEIEYLKKCVETLDQQALITSENFAVCKKIKGLDSGDK